MIKMSLDKFLDPKFFITENFKVILKKSYTLYRTALVWGVGILVLHFSICFL